MTPARVRAYGALAVAVAGIAWSSIFVRWAGVPGPASALYRVLIAAVVLVPWRFAHPHAVRPSVRAILGALAGGVFFAFDLALWNTSVLRTTAASAVLLGNNAPVFVGLAAWWISGRRPRLAFWLGLALALAGCATMVGEHLGTGGAARFDGDALALAASVFFAGYLVTTERARAGMDTLTFSTLAVAGSVVTLAVICAALHVPLWGYGARTWLALAGLGLISQLAAYFALAYALGQLPATVTSVGLLAQVPLAALLAIPLLGEPLSGPQIAGGLLVLAGIVVVNQQPAV
ncbi:MAG TPA: DMT family transporter [Vicinamibacterales bacterium]|nr:DMT family transporter [Vicinamibacterales bacterium]